MLPLRLNCLFLVSSLFLMSLASTAWADDPQTYKRSGALSSGQTVPANRLPTPLADPSHNVPNPTADAPGASVQRENTTPIQSSAKPAPMTNGNCLTGDCDLTINGSTAPNVKPGDTLVIKSKLIKAEPHLTAKVTFTFKEFNYPLKTLYVGNGFIKAEVPADLEGADKQTFKITIEEYNPQFAVERIRLENKKATFIPKIAEVNTQWFNKNYMYFYCQSNCFPDGKSKNDPLFMAYYPSPHEVKFSVSKTFENNDVFIWRSDADAGMKFNINARYKLKPQFTLKKFSIFPNDYENQCPAKSDNIYHPSNVYKYGSSQVINTSNGPIISSQVTAQVTHCRQRVLKVLYGPLGDYEYKHLLMAGANYYLTIEGPAGVNPWDMNAPTSAQ